MTVIAFDGDHVAADTLIVNESGLVGRCRKLEIYNNQVLAHAGAADHGAAMAMWFKMGKKPAAFPHVVGDKDAYLYVFEYLKPVMCFQKWPAPILFPVSEFSAGSGNEIARTAMRLGRSAMGAALLACDLNVYCGGDVEYVDLQAVADGHGEVLVYDHD
jgi:hypothetical protein